MGLGEEARWGEKEREIARRWEEVRIENSICDVRYERDEAGAESGYPVPRRPFHRRLPIPLNWNSAGGEQHQISVSH
jgi:hypothetical protein